MIEEQEHKPHPNMLAHKYWEQLKVDMEIERSAQEPRPLVDAAMPKVPAPLYWLEIEGDPILRVRDTGERRVVLLAHGADAWLQSAGTIGHLGLHQEGGSVWYVLDWPAGIELAEAVRRVDRVSALLLNLLERENRDEQ